MKKRGFFILMGVYALLISGCANTEQGNPQDGTEPDTQAIVRLGEFEAPNVFEFEICALKIHPTENKLQLFLLDESFPLELPGNLLSFDPDGAEVAILKGIAPGNYVRINFQLARTCWFGTAWLSNEHGSFFYGGDGFLTMGGLKAEVLEGKINEITLDSQTLVDRLLNVTSLQMFYALMQITTKAEAGDTGAQMH